MSPPVHRRGLAPVRRGPQAGRRPQGRPTAVSVVVSLAALGRCCNPCGVPPNWRSVDLSGVLHGRVDGSVKVGQPERDHRIADKRVQPDVDQ